jgi:hypothetical protein
MYRKSLPKIGIMTVGAALASGAALAASGAQGAPLVSPAAAAAVLVEAPADNGWGGSSVSPAAHLNAVEYKGVRFSVSDEQLHAYDALPAELKLKLKAPVGGKVMSTDEINSLNKAAQGTVMCQW